MDDIVRIPGTGIRVGIDSIIGFIVPGAGDVVGGASAIALLIVAAKTGVPKIVMLRMVVNMAVDAVFGAIPIIGDIFDIAWKANRKNLELVRRYQSGPRRPSATDYLVVLLAVVVALLALALPIIVVSLVWDWARDKF
jgi:hypothetical protein